MFPANQFYTTVTLFTPYTDKVTRKTRFYRKVLKRCYRNADSLTITRTGGTAAPEQVHLEIPLKFNGGYGKPNGVYTQGYISRSDWQSISVPDLDKFWTILIGGDNTNRSVILDGEVEFPVLEEWGGVTQIGEAYMSFETQYRNLLRYPVNIDEMLIGFKSDYKVNCAC